MGKTSCWTDGSAVASYQVDQNYFNSSNRKIIWLYTGSAISVLSVVLLFVKKDIVWVPIISAMLVWCTVGQVL